MRQLLQRRMRVHARALLAGELLFQQAALTGCERCDAQASLPTCSDRHGGHGWLPVQLNRATCENTRVLSSG